MKQPLTWRSIGLGLFLGLGISLVDPVISSVSGISSFAVLGMVGLATWPEEGAIALAVAAGSMLLLGSGMVIPVVALGMVLTARLLAQVVDDDRAGRLVVLTIGMMIIVSVLALSNGLLQLNQINWLATSLISHLGLGVIIFGLIEVSRPNRLWRK
ncbi:hypothetical protein HYZ64_01715 [Candidatus Berkelbacteria bacterium]|nr:hypothetical protein [Candidatus Berkelbacteria bacterium]